MTFWNQKTSKQQTWLLFLAQVLLCHHVRLFLQLRVRNFQCLSYPSSPQRNTRALINVVPTVAPCMFRYVTLKGSRLKQCRAVQHSERCVIKYTGIAAYKKNHIIKKLHTGMNRYTSQHYLDMEEKLLPGIVSPLPAACCLLPAAHCRGTTLMPWQPPPWAGLRRWYLDSEQWQRETIPGNIPFSCMSLQSVLQGVKAKVPFPPIPSNHG